MTVKAIRKLFQKELEQHYPPEEIQALTSVLLEELKGWDKARIIVHADEELKASDEDFLFDALTRLRQFEPIQYILGKDEFFGMSLEVGPGVLIPRPETEELIYLLASFFDKEKALCILDVGTGSCCIALALSKQFPNALVSACDISDTALQFARRNADKNHLAVNFFKADMLKPEIDFPDKSYDLIVSNPPYVRESEKKQMQRNVLDYEPATALFVPDEDPLKFYYALHDLAIKKLKPGGIVALEINEFLGEETTMVFRKSFADVKLHKDIMGKNRFITARRT